MIFFKKRNDQLYIAHFQTQTCKGKRDSDASDTRQIIQTNGIGQVREYKHCQERQLLLSSNWLSSLENTDQSCLTFWLFKRSQTFWFWCDISWFLVSGSIFLKARGELNKAAGPPGSEALLYRQWLWPPLTVGLDCRSPATIWNYMGGIHRRALLLY